MKDVETKRERLFKLYKTDTWKAKVKAFSDTQVQAVYLSFIRRKIL